MLQVFAVVDHVRVYNSLLVASLGFGYGIVTPPVVSKATACGAWRVCPSELPINMAAMMTITKTMALIGNVKNINFPALIMLFSCGVFRINSG